MQDALGAERTTAPLVPWDTDLVEQAVLPSLVIDPPLVSMEHDGATLRVHACSSRSHAPTVVLFARSQAHVTVQGIATPWRRFDDGWRGVPVVGVHDGETVDFVLDPAPTSLIAMDATTGAPAAAQRVVRARPPSSVPTQDGDHTVALTRINLE